LVVIRKKHVANGHGLTNSKKEDAKSIQEQMLLDYLNIAKDDVEVCKKITKKKRNFISESFYYLFKMLSTYYNICLIIFCPDKSCPNDLSFTGQVRIELPRNNFDIF
jgi:hypothetical protein